MSRVKLPEFPLTYHVPTGVQQVMLGTTDAALGKGSIYKWIKDGTLKCRKLGRRTVVLRNDLEDFINDLPVLNESNKNCNLNVHGGRWAKRSEATKSTESTT